MQTWAAEGPRRVSVNVYPCRAPYSLQRIMHVSPLSVSAMTCKRWEANGEETVPHSVNRGLEEKEVHGHGGDSGA